MLPAARLIAACCAALVIAGGAHAHGQTQPVAPAPGLDITWRGPEGCDQGDALRAKVARLLSGSQLDASDRIAVTVSVHHDQRARFVAELELRSAAGAGKKRLEGESCDAVALASAVVIALSIDPNASLDAAEPSEEPKPEQQPRQPRAQPRPVAPARPAQPRTTLGYVHGSVGALFELLGAPSAFAAVGVGARHRRFSLELGGALYQPREVAHASRQGVGARLALVSGELLGCYAALPFELGALELCPGLRVEHLSASAFGVSDPDEASVLVSSGLAAARGRLRATSWLAATVDVGVAARAFQPTFVLVGVGNVFEIPIFSPLARTGLVVEF